MTKEQLTPEQRKAIQAYFRAEKSLVEQKAYAAKTGLKKADRIQEIDNVLAFATLYREADAELTSVGLSTNHYDRWMLQELIS